MTTKQELATVKDLVLHVLKTKPNTRNSDTLLYLEACKYIGAKTIEDIERIGLNIISVHKIRQVIQNKEGLYLPDKEIRSERKRRSSDIREYMRNLNEKEIK